MKATTNVSYPQARRSVENKMSKQPAKSYAQVAKKQTKTSSTQTDDLPQLPPLKLLNKPNTADSSTTTASSPALEPPVNRRVNPQPKGDRTRPQAAARAESSRVNDRSDATQPAQTEPNPAPPPPPPPPTPPDTRRNLSLDRQSRPAIRVAPGRKRSISSNRISAPPSGGNSTTQ